MSPGIDEGKVVALVIAAIRYGIDRDSLIKYMIDEVRLTDSVARETCFLRALEINEVIEHRHGKALIPIALICEIVRVEFMGETPSEEVTSVVALHSKASPNEVSLDKIGARVTILDQAGEWVCVETVPGTCGWVPRKCLARSSLEI